MPLRLVYERTLRRVGVIPKPTVIVRIEETGNKLDLSFYARIFSRAFLFYNLKVIIMKNEKLKKMIVISIFTAIAFITVALIRIPFVPSVEFLKYEAKDVIIAIVGFLFGPLSAVFVSVAVSFIEMLTISTTGPYGLVMNIFSSLAFVLPAAIIYKKNKTIQSAVIGLVAGVLTMTASMLMWNYFITPLYMGVPTEAVVGLLLPGILPFNIIKSLINAVLTFILYKPLVTVLRKANLMPSAEITSNTENKSAIIYNVIAAVLLVVLITVIIILKFSNNA